MNSLNRKISSIVILCIAMLQLIIAAARYIDAKTTLANPLIPPGLKDAVANFSILIAGCYLLVIMLSVYYLWQEKLFWPVTIISLLIMVGLALFGHQIHDYYFRSIIKA